LARLDDGPRDADVGLEVLQVAARRDDLRLEEIGVELR
jgi:hypothetical protein